MNRVLSQKSLIWVGVVAALILFASRNVQAQIGPGSLTLTLDGVTASNGYSDGGTGASVTRGTQLTAGISVQGVTGNGGTTTVTCYANGNEIYSWSTSVNGNTTFPWEPTSSGSYDVYCEGTWQGNHINGTVDTPTITVPVTQ